MGLTSRRCAAAVIILLISGVCVGAQDSSGRTPPSSQEKFFIPKGTPVKLSFTKPVSSATAKIGDPVELQVTEDVKIGDVVVIPKGSDADGFVSDVSPAHIWGSGRLGVYVGSVSTRTGLSVPVYTVFTADAGSASGDSKEAVIAKDTSVVATTELDVPLDKDLYLDAAASSQKGPGQ